MIDIFSKNGQSLGKASKFQYNGIFMGESYLTFDIDSPVPINFEIGDYLDYRGERYELNYTPAKSKTSSLGSTGDAFKYKGLKFDSLANELSRCDFCDYILNDNNIHYSGLPDFQFYGNVHDLANRIQANLNKVYSGDKQWSVVVSPDISTPNKLINVSRINCWQALSLANSEFGLNFVTKGRVVTIGTTGISISKIFGYGKGNGLITIEQQTNNNANIITRLKAFGSTRNLPDRYYNKLTNSAGNPLLPESMYVKNLMLPGFAENGGNAYIDSPNIEKYGIRPGSVYFDGSDSNLPEIFPSLEGMTAEELKAAGVQSGSTGDLDVIVSAEQIQDNGVPPQEGNGTIQSTFTVNIKDIGFNINDYLKTGIESQVSMKTGMCAERTFDIVKCEKVTGGYKLTLNREEDSDLGLYYPYNRYNIAAGDKFVLLNIEMPNVYVKAAEQRLLKYAKEYLNNNDKSKYTYIPKIDEVFMARNPEIHDTIKEGDIFNFADTDLGIDGSVIIQTLTIKEGNSIPEYEITLFNDKIISGTIGKIQNQISSLANNLGITLEQAKSLFYTLINAWYPDWFDQKLHTYDNVKFKQVVAEEFIESETTETGGVSMLLVEEGSEVAATTLGELTNVDAAVDTAKDGCFLVKENDIYAAKFPTKFEINNLGDLLIPAYDIKRNTWIFISGDRFGTNIPPVTTGFPYVLPLTLS